MDSIRVILWGLGAMGSGVGNYLREKKGLEIVGAICSTERKNGKDLGDVLGCAPMGITCSNVPGNVLDTPADLVLMSTVSYTKDNFPQLEQAITRGLNVITISEEMAYPWAQEPALAERIDKLARDNNVTVLGTGINPGFVLDLLIITLTGACARVDSIKAARVNDLSPFGPTVMKGQGVGTTPEEFRAGIKDGSIVGHVGFPESIRMIADALGWELDEIVQTREPIISTVARETPHVTVKPGMVAGCRHTVQGIRDGRALITLEHPQQIHPHLEGQDTGDYIHIEGDPPINLEGKPEIPGGIGTMAVAMNMIPRVMAAAPGLTSMKDLPVPVALMGDVRTTK